MLNDNFDEDVSMCASVISSFKFAPITWCHVERSFSSYRSSICGTLVILPSALTRHDVTSTNPSGDTSALPAMTVGTLFSPAALTWHDVI
jgi:hypothetical protein